MNYNVVFYQTFDGHIPYKEYIQSLRDKKAKLAIMKRLQRVALGNLGDHHSLSDGLHEIRINYGPGYRIYYTWHGTTLIILLLAGDKSTQSQDIPRAKIYVADLKRRNYEYTHS